MLLLDTCTYPGSRISPHTTTRRAPTRTTFKAHAEPPAATAASLFGWSISRVRKLIQASFFNRCADVVTGIDRIDRVDDQLNLDGPIDIDLLAEHLATTPCDTVRFPLRCFLVLVASVPLFFPSVRAPNRVATFAWMLSAARRGSASRSHQAARTHAHTQPKRTCSERVRRE